MKGGGHSRVCVCPGPRAAKISETSFHSYEMHFIVQGVCVQAELGAEIMKMRLHSFRTIVQNALLAQMCF